MKKRLLCTLLAMLMLLSICCIPGYAEESGWETITLGTYEQNGLLSDGPEELEWLVLDEKDGKLLLLSRYALTCLPFNESGENCTWETSSVRAWLNGEFLETAFSPDLAGTICTTKIENERYSKGADCGNDTEDKIFLLSEYEADHYFARDSQRRAQASGMCEADTNENGNCWWMLRTMGNSSKNVMGVHEAGGLNYSGRSIDEPRAIRPVMWVESDKGTGGNESSSTRYWMMNPNPDIWHDSIFLGRYEQDGDESNGPEDIEWLILDREGDSALVISRYCLEVLEDDSNEYVENWLNGEFLNDAFSEDEQGIIQESDRIYPDAEKALSKNLFLLNSEEANTNFRSVDACRGIPTAHIGPSADEGVYSWLYVSGMALGENYYSDYAAIRPAAWIKLDDSIEITEAAIKKCIDYVDCLVWQAALNPDGTVSVSQMPGRYCGLSAEDIAEINSWTDVVDIEGAGTYLLGLKSDGTVECVGSFTGDPEEDKFCGYKIEEVEEWKDVKQIIALSYSDGNYSPDPKRIVGLQNDGTVLIAGAGGFTCTEMDVVTEWKNIKELEHENVQCAFCLLGVAEDGRVYDIFDGDEFGDRYTEGLSDILGETKVVDVSTDGNFCAAAMEDGRVKAWTYRGELDVRDEWNGKLAEEVSQLTNVVQVCVADDCVFALRGDGTLVYANANRYDSLETYKLDGLRNVISIDAYGRKMSYSDHQIICVYSNGKAELLHLDSDALHGGDPRRLSYYIQRKNEIEKWEDLIAVGLGSCTVTGYKSDGTKEYYRDPIYNTGW